MILALVLEVVVDNYIWGYIQLMNIGWKLVHYTLFNSSSLNTVDVQTVITKSISIIISAFTLTLIFPKTAVMDWINI